MYFLIKRILMNVGFLVLFWFVFFLQILRFMYDISRGCVLKSASLYLCQCIPGSCWFSQIFWFPPHGVREDWTQLPIQHGHTGIQVWKWGSGRGRFVSQRQKKIENRKVYQKVVHTFGALKTDCCSQMDHHDAVRCGHISESCVQQNNSSGTGLEREERYGEGGGVCNVSGRTFGAKCDLVSASLVERHRKIWHSVAEQRLHGSRESKDFLTSHILQAKIHFCFVFRLEIHVHVN